MNDEHKYMFDRENLIYILQSTELVNVMKRKFYPSCDRLERHYESLYAIGTRA